MRILIEHDYEDIKNTKYEEMIAEYDEIIKSCILKCLNEENIIANDLEIYIKYTDNTSIQKINKEYRNIDNATDVLSFPMYDVFDDNVKEELSKAPIVSFGDIIISVEKIEEQSKEYGHAFERELIYLITHAMFHLLGYDHIKDSDKEEMRNKEERIMSLLNILR